MEDAELHQISSIPSARLVLSQSQSSATPSVIGSIVVPQSPKMSHNRSHEAFANQAKKVSIPL